MTTEIFAFAVGIIYLQGVAQLPSLTMQVGATAGGLTLVLLAWWARRVRRAPRMGPGRGFARAGGIVGLALIGCAWAGLLADLRLADALPAESEGQDMVVTGVISGLPQSFERGWRFDFDIESASLAAPRRISLAWYRGRQLDDAGDQIQVQPVHAGERWRFTVRLKRPHGNLNPHGFDYEAWLLEQGIRATGYVRPRGEAQRLTAFVPGFGTGVQALRENIRSRFLAVLGEAPHGGILIALAVGDQRAIPAEQWAQFARTGLTHLLSVSGLHITLVAGLVYGLCNSLWRRADFLRPALSLRIPAQTVAALGGVAGAFAYALLAGFAVPAQRTLYMVTVVALTVLLRRTMPVRQVLALALGTVLLLDPWAVLAAGFWLSFGAVALLLYVARHPVGGGHWLADWGRAQWAMTIGMLPAMLALFQQFSLVSPLANAVAIPLVSFVITPLVLLATLPGFEWLLHPALWLADALMAGVDFLAASEWAQWQQAAPPSWAVATGMVGALWVLAPRGFPGRWLGVPLVAPLLLSPPLRPEIGVARVTVLDVGQGLAVHVQTAAHDLVFDTGPEFSPDANSGNRIIVPYLRALGVRRLDGVVVSHADSDHSGGAASLLEALPAGWVLSSLPDGHPLRPAAPGDLRCFAGQRWAWDGVAMTVLHPPWPQYATPTRKTNDMSCVLRIDAGGHSMLLASDIEAISEAVLLAANPEALRAEVLVVPHHGSRTSSTPAFVAAVAAQTVIYPVGYRNRFGHPKEEVVARYEADGIRALRTDRDGAVRVDLGPAGVALGTARADAPRYWSGR